MKMPTAITIREVDGMSLTVRLSYPLRLRIWLGLRLIRLATAVMGVGVNIEDGAV